MGRRLVRGVFRNAGGISVRGVPITARKFRNTRLVRYRDPRTANALFPFTFSNRRASRAGLEEPARRRRRRTTRRTHGVSALSDLTSCERETDRTTPGPKTHVHGAWTSYGPTARRYNNIMILKRVKTVAEVAGAARVRSSPVIAVYGLANVYAFFHRRRLPYSYNFSSSPSS